MIERSRLTAWLLALTVLPTPIARGQGEPVKNVVLVHGAWVDGSGWKPVYDILVKDGYSVSVVQEPLTSFDADVAAARRILGLVPGPCVLVGHSYGGSIITQAGADSHVSALVYVAAHMPDAGESEGENGKRFPSDLAKSKAVQTTADRYTYLDPALFPSYFAPDLPGGQAHFEAHSQVLTAAANFAAKITAPAWRRKPSWMIVAGGDRIISPQLERWYGARAHSHVSEIAGASHSVYESHPKEVAAVIEDAARAASR